MSANNVIVVNKTLSGKFSVSVVDVDGAGGFFITDDHFSTLEEAVLAANEYMDDCAADGYPVEYGMEVNL